MMAKDDAKNTEDAKGSPSSPEVRISAAAQAAGVSSQTIEYYIMIGLVEPIRHKGRSGRFFDEKIIRRIKLIHELNETGYTLQNIRDIYLKNLKNTTTAPD